jgi:hypothetical protein
MSAASEGIWFPIANNHHLHNPINDQAADNIPATINPHEAIPRKSGAYRTPPTRYPVANDLQSNKSITDKTPDDVRPLINAQETSSTNRTSIHPGYWSPIGSQAKTALLDGYTQLITDRVRAGWSCNLVTFLFSQVPGTRSIINSRMKDEVQRVYSTLLTRVHRKPRTASADELPVLIGAVDLPVYKRDKASGPMVLCNGGLHVHALMLMPPTSRLKGSLADHFREKQEVYVASGRSIQRIDVRPVVEDHRRVVDYVLKTVLNGRLSYDEAVLVLPRARGELETGE